MPDPDDDTLDFREITGMDPRANWLLREIQSDFVPDPDTMPIPFVLWLKTGAAIKAFEAMLKATNDDGRHLASMIGFDELGLADVRPNVPIPVAGSLDLFVRLATCGDDDEACHPFKTAPKTIVLSSPLRGSIAKFDLKIERDAPRGVRQTFAEYETIYSVPPPSSANTVYMAVIDDGIAFAHDRFRRSATQTRVHAHWDMNQGFAGIRGPAQIDALMAGAMVGGVVDEDKVYRDAKLVDFADIRHKTAAWRIAHGTHVLDLAAGYDWRTAPELAEALARPIIAVEIPAEVIANPISALDIDFHVLAATYFAVLSAPAGSKLVINISLGYVAGPHDGTKGIETIFDAFSASGGFLGRRVRIVLAAGNMHLERLRAEIDLQPPDTPQIDVDWVLQPDDRTESIMEVWLPRKPGPPTGRMTLSLTSPSGTTSLVTVPASGGSMPPDTDVLDDAVKVGMINLTEVASGKRRIIISMQPTVRLQPSTSPVAPAGRWRVRFTALDGPIVADAWIQRDDSIYGRPLRGRQSYFEHQDYLRWDYDATTLEITDDTHPSQGPCPVTRASLFNAIATGRLVLTAGGYLVRDGQVARYSAGGPNTPPEPAPLKKPDALCASEGSRAHPGRLAAGSRSGAAVPSGGTSAAAPEMARWIADDFEAGGAANRATIAAGATPSGGPPERSGHGLLPVVNIPRVKRFDI